MNLWLCFCYFSLSAALFFISKNARINEIEFENVLDSWWDIWCRSELLVAVGMIVLFLYSHILLGLMGLKRVSNADNLGKSKTIEVNVPSDVE